MHNLQPKYLKFKAQQALNRAPYDPTRLAFIYFGISLLISGVLLALDYILSQGIGGTGGLSGMGNRAILTTAQNVLSLAQILLTPFWQAGWVLCTIAILHREGVTPVNLLDGFRQVWRIFRLHFMQYLLMLAAVFVGVYTVMLLYSMTPVSTPFIEAVSSNPQDLEGIMAAMGNDFMPIMVIALSLGLLLGLFMAYLLRFALIRYLKDQNAGILRSLFGSMGMVLKNFGRIILLDLSFWWVWVIEGLCTGAYLMAAVFAELQMWHGWVLYVTFGIGELVRLLASVLFRPKMDVTYVAAVEAMDGSANY